MGATWVERTEGILKDDLNRFTDLVPVGSLGPYDLLSVESNMPLTHGGQSENRVAIVVFPEPDSPTSATVSPFFTSNETSLHGREGGSPSTLDVLHGDAVNVQ